MKSIEYQVLKESIVRRAFVKLVTVMRLWFDLKGCLVVAHKTLLSADTRNFQLPFLSTKIASVRRTAINVLLYSKFKLHTKKQKKQNGENKLKPEKINCSVQ